MQTKQLKRHLAVLKSTTAAKVLYPILANVALNGKMITTDSEHWTIIDQQCNVQGTTASLKQLEAVVKTIKHATIDLEQDGNILRLQAGSIQSSLPAIDIDEFPALPELTPDTVAVFDFKDFVDCLKRLVFSAASYDANNVLGGVTFIFSPDGFEAASTDGSRLGKYNIPGLKTENKTQLNIPASMLGNIYKAFKTDKEQSTVEFHYLADSIRNDYVQIRIGVYTFIVRLLEGQYPRYNQLIPINQHYHYKVDRKALIDGLKTVGAFANPRTNVVKFDLGYGVQLTACTPDTGETTLAVPGVWPLTTDDSLKTAFNYKYVLDALEAIDADFVRLSMNNGLSPAIFTGYGTDSNFLELVMPVQVK